ncbi:hypothetical protein GCM10007862_02270 [Dyella lipolytica]|uniref:DUF4239 domain-containing protein n=1 Tax=Dyella lipolytica TaxID=1867835 RepID=A0ABW8IRD9_9GAMM|nr:hypothetical protein [Dyella lipolytica]GLQ45176.1 hypothetical protein GCM10007862_02270 [Dyella lipolytica]
MVHLLIAMAVFIWVFAMALLGLELHKRLPKHHFSDESTSSIKLATGLIATIAALVLGLLISSAKNSFDTVNADLVRNAVNIIRLDRTLEQYGPETQGLREQLKQSYATWVDMLGSGDPKKLAQLENPELVGKIESFQRELAQLTPKTAMQQQLQARCISLADDVFTARWLALLQRRGSIPVPLLFVLVAWLSIIFGAFGLFAPHNGTVIFFFLMCAFSAAGAIFVILEMDTPLNGFINISVAPLREALAHLRP